MSSAARVDWENDRRHRIDDLLDAHARIGGVGPGRRWRTEQLNWALVLRVAAEFQGFSRDLHDQAIEHFLVEAAPLNAALQGTLRARLTEGRKLDTGNAQPSSLGSDFGRFGMQFWPQLRGAHGQKAERWRDTLEALNTARNSIAHADETKIANLAATGWPISQLETMRRFQRAADALGQAMDTEVSAYLVRLFGGAAPW